MANVFDQFDPAPVEKRGNVFDQFDPPRTPTPEEFKSQGFLDEAGRAIRHGVTVTIPRTVGESIEYVGKVAESPAVTAYGRDISRAAIARETPDNRESTVGQYNDNPWSIRGNVYEAFDSAVQSFGPGLAGAATGAAAGAVFTPIGALTGAIAGFALGMGSSILSAAGSQGNESYDAVLKNQLSKGRSPEAARSVALQASLGEALTTAGGELVGDIPLLFMGPAGAPAKAATGSLVRSALRSTAGQAAKRTGAVVGAETATEVGQTVASAQIRESIGETGPGVQGDDIARTITQTAMMSLIPGLGSAGTQAARTRYVRQALESPDTDANARYGILNGVVQGIAKADEQLARDVAAYGYAQIRNGLPIKLDQPDAAFTTFADAVRERAYEQAQQQTMEGEGGVQSPQPQPLYAAEAPRAPGLLALPAPPPPAVEAGTVVPSGPSVAINVPEALPAKSDNLIAIEQAQREPISTNAGSAPVLSGQPVQRSAHEIEIDPADVSGSIAKIAAAPIRPVTSTAPNLDALRGPDEAVHASVAGDLAAMAHHIDALQKQLKLTATDKRGPIKAQIEAIKVEAAQLVANHTTKYGQDITNAVRAAASATADSLRGKYSGLVKSAIPTEPAAQKAEGVSNAPGVRSDAGQVLEGGAGGLASVQRGAVEGGGNLQQQAPEASGVGATQAQPEGQGAGERGQLSTPPKQLPEVKTDVDRAAHEAHASPLNALSATPAQILGDNAKLGHASIGPEGSRIGVSIENPSGSERVDLHNQPPKWRNRMKGVHYGRIKETVGADGDHVDVFIKEGTPDSWDGPVFVINQRKTGGGFDEHKVMVGFASEKEAVAAYNDQYPAGWRGLDSVGATTMRGLREWLDGGDLTQPFSARPRKERYVRETPVDPATGLDERGMNAWERGEPGVEVPQANPGEAVRLSSKVGLADIGGLARLITDPVREFFVDIYGIAPVADKHARLVAQAIHALVQAGVPESAFDGVSSIGVHTYGGAAEFVSDEQGTSTISLRQNVLESAMKGEGGWRETLPSLIAHELGHHVDVANQFSAAAGFDIRTVKRQMFAYNEAEGPLVREAMNAVEQTGRSHAPTWLREYLSYPLNHWLSDAVTQDFLKSELFAQMHALYYTNPAQMKAHLPKNFVYMEEVHNETKQAERTGSVADDGAVRGEVREPSPGREAGTNLEQAQDRLGGAVGDRGGQAGRGLGVTEAVDRNAPETATGLPDITVPLASRRGSTKPPGPSRDQLNREHIPGYAEAVGGLLPSERPKIERADLARKFVALFTKMPSTREFAAVAWAGRAKRGWYRKSTLALHQIFGPDAPRFAALLAAMSPQTSVESNLENALRTWVNWVAAGRPTTHREIRNIMARSVQGKKGEESVLYAWVPNSIRALTSVDPGQLVISGPKVNSFFANLVGVVDEVTNDAWMASFAHVNQRLFSGSLSADGTDPGKRPGYLSMSARVRLAAQQLTKLTGETWTPAEVQETVWSWSKALYESANTARSADDIIKNRELSDAVINATPDFGHLLTENETYSDLLTRGGYAEGLSAAAASSRESSRLEAELARARAGGEAAPFAAGTQLRLERSAAKRLDRVRKQRLDEAEQKVIDDLNAEVEALWEEKSYARAEALWNSLQAERRAGGIAPYGTAVYDDFREDPETALRKDGWGVITATRESVGPADHPANIKANEKLDAELTQLGIEHYPVKGQYLGVDQGTSFLAFASEATLSKLGEHYYQESVLTKRGFVYGDGTVSPVEGDFIVGPEAKKQDGYTVLPDGTAFSMNIGDRTATPPAPRASRSGAVMGTELAGDGLGFRDFFTAASKGERAPDVKTYTPVIDITSIAPFSAEYVKHRGNFDDHIATSIPGFREAQQAVGDALVKTYAPAAVTKLLGENLSASDARALVAQWSTHRASMSPTKRNAQKKLGPRYDVTYEVRSGQSTNLLDIAASEGAFNKTITKLSGGKIRTIALDPNLQMAKFFREHSSVPNATYDVSAFSGREDEGKTLWTEDDGTEIKGYVPDRKFDVVHEAMGFQFISNTRNAQFARVKELMKPDGIFLTEEKVIDDSAQWKANEAQKDEYKARYFSAQKIAEKKAEVLEKGADVVASEDSKKEQSVVGMNNLMVTPAELETVLRANFKHVSQYWDSGNFKGYVASDNKAAIDRFLGNLIDLNSEFSTIRTPHDLDAPAQPAAPRASRAGRNFGNLTSEQEQALRNVGGIVDRRSLTQWFADVRKDIGAKLVQNVVDQFAPIKALDTHAYNISRLSKASDGALEALFVYGNLQVVDGVTNATVGGEGVIQAFRKLQGEHHRFMWWIAANRAEQLAAEDREHLFGTQDIAALKLLNDGNMPDGQSRSAVYTQALADYNRFSKSVLDVAEQSGIIDGASRATWEREFYVPFYRAIEDGVSGPNIGAGGGMIRQYAFKQLKGGKEKLNQDLLANVMMNWSHLLSASAKNRGATLTLQAAERAGIAIEVPSDYVAAQIQSSLGMPKNSVWYLDQGAKRYYVVDDERVLAAVSALSYTQLGGPAVKLLSQVKNVLTIGVTANPAFKVRNLMRDSISALAMSNGLSLNVAKNVVSGTKVMREKGQVYASALASGGLIRFGSMLEGNRSSHVSKLIDMGVPRNTIVDTPERLKDMMQAIWDRYNELGDISEGVNRMALFQQTLDSGGTLSEAALAARDLLDFSMGGTSQAVRFLAQVVPFFNARLQGLYRLGRAARENTGRFALVTTAVALASVALMAAYQDDDDWKRREDWDRDNFWWFKLGDVAWRIPKPFEIGAIGTLAERGVELFADDEMTQRRFLKRVQFALSSTFAMNPVPQLFKPLLDVYANVDSFTGRSIETAGMESLPKQFRAAPNTTTVANVLGAAAPLSEAIIGTGLSPVQIDHLVRGYFGWLGTMALTASEVAVSPLTDKPDKPSMQLKDVFFAGNFVETLPTNSSRYITQFYEQAVEIRQAYAEHQHLLKMGDVAGAAEYRQENLAEIRAASAERKISKALADIRARENRIYASTELTPDQKREQLDQLAQLKHKVARDASRVLPGL